MQQPASGWLIYRRLLRYAFVYWPALIVAVLTMIIMALTEAGLLRCRGISVAE